VPEFEAGTAIATRKAGDLLALLCLHPEQAFSLTDLAKRLRASLPTVMREADRLTAAGLVRGADRQHPPDPRKH
jgi:DNA-binding IclR family transcriptional regulator